MIQGYIPSFQNTGIPPFQDSRIHLFLDTGMHLPSLIQDNISPFQDTGIHHVYPGYRDITPLSRTQGYILSIQDTGIHSPSQDTGIHSPSQDTIRLNIKISRFRIKFCSSEPLVGLMERYINTMYSLLHVLFSSLYRRNILTHPVLISIL